MALTLVGLVLSEVVLFSGLVYFNTYREYSKKEYGLFEKNHAIVVKGEYNYETYEKISRNAVATSLQLYDNVFRNAGDVQWRGKEATVLVSPVRTDCLFEAIAENEMREDSYFSMRLVDGRMLTQADTDEKNNVTVIPESLAVLLYGTKDVVGKKLNYSAVVVNESGEYRTYYYEPEIVGVVSDRMTATEHMEECLQREGLLGFPIYVPLSYIDVFAQNNQTRMRIIAVHDADGYFAAVQDAIVWVDDKCTVTSYYDLKDKADRENAEARRLILLLVSAMLVVSGICIANTMAFSVKERVNEIGIRKAVGAFRIDIVGQFAWEGFLYGAVSAGIGIVIGILVDSIVYLEIIRRGLWNPEVGLAISMESVVATAVTAILVSMIAAIAPAIYASSIKVADAIRFD